MSTEAGVLEFYDIATHAFTLLFNGILIYLIVYHTKSNMGTYKYLMICFAIFGLFFNAVTFVTQSDFILFDYSMFIVYKGAGQEYLGHFAQTILVTILSGFFCESIVLLAFHFIYRYFAICRPNLLYLFSTPRSILIWVSIFAAISGTFMILCLIMTKTTSETVDYAAEFIMQRYNVNISAVGYIGVVLMVDDEYQWKQLPLVLIQFFLILSFVFPIPFLVFCIVRRFRTIEMSPKTRSLHKQLLTALSLQTLLPLLTTHLPDAALFLCPVFGYTPNIQLGSYIPILFAIYPTLDPLISIVFISEVDLNV